MEKGLTGVGRERRSTLVVQDRNLNNNNNIALWSKCGGCGRSKVMEQSL